MSPTPDHVREQLDRILQSPTFASAGRHTRLLRYLVERTLAGEGDQLKEYVLGTEVFDRAESYDPRLDSIVRVEVRRLRARLEEYYSGPGAGDPVTIAIPRGNYAPTFSGRVGAPTPVARSVPAAVDSRLRQVTMFVSAAGFLLIIGAIVAQLLSSRAPSAQASSGPSIVVLPFEHYSIRESDARLAARLTDAVTTELARLRTLSVASRTSAAQYSSETRSITEIRKALNVDFVLEATATSTISADTIQLTVRIVDALRDRKVWVADFSTTDADVAAAARRIAAAATDAALAYEARNPTARE